MNHLVGSTPGEPGKWFATAKTLKLLDRATQLAWASPCDPKTLTRAARYHLVKQPAFAMQCALAALHWMSMGHGYELTGFDAHEAHRLAVESAGDAQQSDQAQAAIEQLCWLPTARCRPGCDGRWASQPARRHRGAIETDRAPGRARIGRETSQEMSRPDIAGGIEGAQRNQAITSNQVAFALQPLPVFNAARTVVDCFRFRNKIGLDVALQALREGWRLRKFTLDALWRHAQRGRVANVMRPYIEAITS